LQEGSRPENTVDLCSPATVETIKYTEVLPPGIILEWHPDPHAKGDDILAFEIIFAAVGRGEI